jgi:ribonuclease HII
MDETGRGSMVSSLVAACVILPDDYNNPKINDSKKLTHTQLEEFEKEIKENALFYKIVEYENSEIDTIGVQQINISAFLSLKDFAESTL